MSAEDDMREFITQRLYALNRDMQWRCEALDIGPSRWAYLLMSEYLLMGVRIAATVTEPGDDREFAQAVFNMLQDARRELAANKAKEQSK